MEHCYEFMEITGHTLAYNSDEVIETTHGRLRHFEKVHNFTNKRTVSGKSKSISNRSSFNYWNATHAKLNPNNGRIQKKLRKRRQVRYFECDVESSTAAPEAPDYYNPAAPTADRTDRAGAAGEGAEVCTDGDDQTQVSVCSRSQPQPGDSEDPNSWSLPTSTNVSCSIPASDNLTNSSYCRISSLILWSVDAQTSTCSFAASH